MKYFFALLLCLSLAGCNKGPNTDCPICGRAGVDSSTCPTCIRTFVGASLRKIKQPTDEMLIIDHPDTGERVYYSPVDYQRTWEMVYYLPVHDRRTGLVYYFEIDTSWVCPTCKSKHGKPAARCPNCGQPRLNMDKIRRQLVEKRKKEQEPVPKVRRVRMDPYTGEPIDSLWVCIDCGYRDDTIHTECPNCGVPDQSNFTPLMPGK